MPEALVAVAAGSALFLALATAAVMIRDSRWGPSTVATSTGAAARAPAPAAPSPVPAAPSAVEPRFPADQPDQLPVQDAANAQSEEKPFPAPVAPSLELLGPPPADMRFAVHLASFSSEKQAHAGWEILARRYRGQLAGLSSLVRRGSSKQGSDVFELFAGPFESLLAASQRCGALTIATASCRAVDLSQSAEGAQSWD